MQLINELAEALPSVDDSKVIGELSDYRSNKGLFSKPFVWKAAQQTSPQGWWTGICTSTQLSQVASRVLELPPTSAAVERSFSRHAWIHSAKRNRLTTERAAKLVFIAHNLKLSEHDEMSENFLTPAIATEGLKDCKSSSSTRSAALISSEFSDTDMSDVELSDAEVSESDQLFSN